MLGTEFELEQKSFVERAVDQLSRLARAVPVVGLWAHYTSREERLREARTEDAGYRALMEKLGEAQPRFPHLSEERERHVMAGELAGFALAMGAGVILYLITRDFRTSWFAAWALGFLADLAGGAVGGWICDRKHPDPDDAATLGEADAD